MKYPLPLLDTAFALWKAYHLVGYAVGMSGKLPSRL